MEQSFIITDTKSSEITDKGIEFSQDRSDAELSLGLEDENSFPTEDNESNAIFNHFRKNVGFLSGEVWNKITNIPSRVVDIKQNFVYCECVTDRQNQVFETRIFDKSHFSHIENLIIGKPILIRTKEKPGAIRIDIIEGENLVDLRLFEVEDLLIELKDLDLGKPFSL